jgi:mannose-6-phosphate isomerase-like protein (cupin superfamily)
VARGEGFDFFHNHREQEEIYVCLEGTADLMVRTAKDERVTLHKGDVARVDAGTMRAIGNLSSEAATVLIAGACTHTYPGYGHHDVIHDVLRVTGEGETGMTWPPSLPRHGTTLNEEERC